MFFFRYNIFALLNILINTLNTLANISTEYVFHITEQENLKKWFSEKYVLTIVLHQALARYTNTQKAPGPISHQINKYINWFQYVQKVG